MPTTQRVTWDGLKGEEQDEMATDLTRPDSADSVEASQEGTAIYWFVTPDGRYEQVFVPRVIRDRAQDLARDFDQAGRQKLDAYRWVADSVESAASLVSRPCGGSCQRDLDCIDNACRCIRGQCRRK